MSWSIKSIGPRAAVIEVVKANQSMPAGIKDALLEIIGDTSGTEVHDSARVEGHGHTGGSYGSIGKLEVELFTAAKLPEPVAEPSAPAASHV